MLDEIQRIDQDYADRSDYAKTLAKSPASSSLSAMTQRYGTDLDANSHGESFLTIFQSRFVLGGLYLLDEPEAALSPLRQMGLISLIKQMVTQDA
jgi:predicted ATPase